MSTDADRDFHATFHSAPTLERGPTVADCVITYNQTDEEHKLGVARLFVSGGRNDEDKITVEKTKCQPMQIGISMLPFTVPLHLNEDLL